MHDQQLGTVPVDVTLQSFAFPPVVAEVIAEVTAKAPDRRQARTDLTASDVCAAPDAVGAWSFCARRALSRVAG